MVGHVTRFAPSPTGFLHLGHAYAAIYAAAVAQSSGGTFLVRIEDTDLIRSKAEFEVAIDEDLGWLGLNWQRPVRRQSEHLDAYASALQKLKDLECIYPCFCTRKAIEAEFRASVGAPQGPDGPIYPGTCKALTINAQKTRVEQGEQHAWRMDVAKAEKILGRSLTFHEFGSGPDGECGQVVVQADVYGDFVLARKDAPASYHLTVVVDDAIQGVTMVTRGSDLFLSSHLHRLLQDLLGLPQPLYNHHRLICDERGQRLAKRDQATSLREIRAKGTTANQVYAMLGFTSRSDQQTI
jgi:glutamyl-Q tRNA(Asp) synthetase